MVLRLAIALVMLNQMAKDEKTEKFVTQQQPIKEPHQFFIYIERRRSKILLAMKRRRSI
jgi:hypothetical protein